MAPLFDQETQTLNTPLCVGTQENFHSLWPWYRWGSQWLRAQ
jgi:hypothetical protein